MRAPLPRHRAMIAVVTLSALALGACGTATTSESERERDRRETPAQRAAEAANGEFDAKIAPPAPTQKFTGRLAPAVSFNGDLRTVPSVAPAKKLRVEASIPSMIPGGGPQADPLVRNAPVATAPLAAAPAPLSTGDGLDFTAFGTGWPPDTTGDVGPNHYIQAVNGSVGIYTKSPLTRVVGLSLNSFFTAAGATGACATGNQGDPTVVYDQISGRWIVSDFAWTGAISTGPWYQCLAVSKTADPVAGGWWVYSVVASTTALNDYPKMSVWGDGIYMTANMFTNASTFAGSRVWAFNRDDLISGATLRYVSFQTSSSYASLLAANARASAVPAGTPEYLLSLGTSTSLRMWRMSVNWTTPSASTLTGPTNITVASYTRAPSATQPTGDKLDALSDRLMNRVQYTATGTPSLWVTHSVSSGNKGAVRWYQVNVSAATPTLKQSGTYAPDTANNRWMGSMAVDKVGNAAVGYTKSGSATYPGLWYAGRTAAATAGTFDQTEQALVAGTGAQKGGYNRWGDYSDLALDPDGCTFWYTGEYYATTGNAWRTRIGSFKLPGCV